MADQLYPQPSKVIQFRVNGIPGTAGSKKFVGFAKSTGRAIIIDNSGKKGKDWRTNVIVAAEPHFDVPLNGPLMLVCHFVLPYRKRDLRKDGTPKPSAPHFHTTKPDTTKMLRALEDSLKGIAWNDDSQVAWQITSKTYGHKSGVLVTIHQLTEKKDNDPPHHINP